MREDGWIACSDRLPDPFVIVLVHGGVALHTGVAWHTVTCTPCPGQPIVWNVFYWMPLPNPPKQ